MLGDAPRESGDGKLAAALGQDPRDRAARRVGHRYTAFRPRGETAFFDGGAGAQPSLRTRSASPRRARDQAGRGESRHRAARDRRSLCLYLHGISLSGGIEPCGRAARPSSQCLFTRSYGIGMWRSIASDEGGGGISRRESEIHSCHGRRGGLLGSLLPR